MMSSIGASFPNLARAGAPLRLFFRPSQEVEAEPAEGSTIDFLEAGLREWIAQGVKVEHPVRAVFCRHMRAAVRVTRIVDQHESPTRHEQPGRFSDAQFAARFGYHVHHGGNGDD